MLFTETADLGNRAFINTLMFSGALKYSCKFCCEVRRSWLWMRCISRELYAIVLRFLACSSCGAKYTLLVSE
ncbi:hypothetical protein Mp_2g16310 [Marchantia polymorpha subsp. ruderalis]|uniref:Uncharacterized protein n=1 Tax=Marchantia polymorpha TaxID=3197 RepID=A0A2R6W9S4_MARPO|nr:hypothetical protein MARPO_0122s0033 [Marchantia polymorpha]BBN02565.1 hypothetical protein Mp_2g16310 [Marchantia polymorpha subsp. ruderalis]|eukprot:PTQ30604.1 hypothetical protein MARPO_0122s0033 [Marchantia polymorpha]